MGQMVGYQEVSYVSCFQTFWLLKCHIGWKQLCNAQVPPTIMVLGGCKRWHIYYGDTKQWIDTSTMVTQNNEFHSFIAQASSSSGRGPCSLPHDREDRNTQIRVVKDYAVEFSNRHAWHAATKENTNPQVFVPASGVRHRLLKTKTGMEGKFLNKKKMKKERANVYKTMHIGLGRQSKEAKGCSQELPDENLPEVVLLAALGVRKCQGCKGKF